MYMMMLGLDATGRRLSPGVVNVETHPYLHVQTLLPLADEDACEAHSQPTQMAPVQRQFVPRN
jgi:hypothetical protein